MTMYESKSYSSRSAGTELSWGAGSKRVLQGRALTLEPHRAQPGSGAGMVPTSWFSARPRRTTLGNGPTRSHDAGMVEAMKLSPCAWHCDESVTLVLLRAGMRLGRAAMLLSFHCRGCTS